MSACFAFVSTPLHFYILRFLLGAAEAGFSPGVLLYLTYWYPAARRGRPTALYFLAIPLSSVVGGPISGGIMSGIDGLHGLLGWQWLFLIEALPAILFGIGALFYLDKGVAEAKWLDADEKSRMLLALECDKAKASEHHSMRGFLSDRNIWVLCASSFCCVMGIYALAFWVPTLIRSTGVADPFDIGLLTALPNLVAVVAIYLSGVSADRNRKRRGYFMIAMVIGAVGLTLATVGPKGTTFAVLSLSVAAAGILSATALFWVLPSALLSGATAAAGIAFVNSVSNLAGFASPYLVGWLNDRTHNAAFGMIAISVFLVIGALIGSRLPAARVNR